MQKGLGPKVSSYMSYMKTSMFLVPFNLSKSYFLFFYIFVVEEDEKLAVPVPYGL